MKWQNGILVIQLAPNAPFVHYRHTEYYLPDYQIANGSPGYRTMQNALNMGVKYVQHQPTSDTVEMPQTPPSCTLDQNRF
jgi:hypothetical protein